MPQVSGATVSIATSPSPSNKMETIQQVVSHYVPFVQGKQLFTSDGDFVCVFIENNRLGGQFKHR